MSESTATELLQHAISAERSGRFDAARSDLRICLDRAKDPLPDVALRLAKLCIQSGDYAEAKSVLQTVLDQRDSPRQAATAIHLLALLALHQGHVDESVRLLDKSAALKQDDDIGPAAAQLLHYRGLVAALKGSATEAEPLFHRAFHLYHELSDSQGLGEVCDSLANLMLRHGKTRAALRFAENSLAHKKCTGDRYGEAVTLGTLGRIEMQLARFDEARERFEADLAIARELGDDSGIGIMLNSLGELSLLRNDPAGAEMFFRENLSANRGPRNQLFAKSGLAWSLLDRNEIDAADKVVASMREILATSVELDTLTPLADAIHGAVAWRRGSHDEGERCLRDIVRTLRDSAHPLDAIRYLYELRDLYQQCGKQVEAVGAMSEALDLWSECGSDRGVQDVENWLRKVDQPALFRLALERHLPGPMVQQVLDGKLAPLRPRLQKLSVLFCDLRDYTTLAENMPPVELVELLNEWFSEANRAVRRHGGFVDKFIGDAVMALFGVPNERDDAAADAIRAALDMRDALAAFNRRQKIFGAPTLRIGIGIDTGEAVVGFVGSHFRQSYTAIGDVVNTASRLEGATKDFRCDIIISGATQKAQERIAVAETSFQGKITVKGRQREVAIYSVLANREKDTQG